MTSGDKAGIVAVSLTFLLAVAIFADAVLASAAWHPPPSRVPNHVPVPAPARAPAPLPARQSRPPIQRPAPIDTTTRVVHVRTGTVETNRMTREAARRAVRRAIPALERCYRAARVSRPDLEGRIVIHVGITIDRIATEMMTTTTGDDTPLEQCLVDVLASAKWPWLGHPAEAVVPLVLDTTAE